ncbi:hypothetical protein V6N13_126172 [Hibiscus sabdariffa]
MGLKPTRSKEENKLNGGPSSQHLERTIERNKILKVIRKYLMKKYIKLFFEIAENKEVVANTCRSIVDIIKDYGYVNLESYMPQNMDATSAVL